jgi:methylphosphotriester-DNA--protein-cysteine methyltransferase
LPYYVEGARKRSVSDVSFDSSYPTGGEIITAANLRLQRVDHAIAQIQTTATTTVNATSAGYIPGDGTTTSALKVFDETPAEVANAADLAGLVVRVTAYGV